MCLSNVFSFLNLIKLTIEVNHHNKHLCKYMMTHCGLIPITLMSYGSDTFLALISHFYITFAEFLFRSFVSLKLLSAEPAGGRVHQQQGNCFQYLIGQLHLGSHSDCVSNLSYVKLKPDTIPVREVEWAWNLSLAEVILPSLAWARRRVRFA